MVSLPIGIGIVVGRSDGPSIGIEYLQEQLIRGVVDGKVGQPLDVLTGGFTVKKKSVGESG